MKARIRGLTGLCLCLLAVVTLLISAGAETLQPCHQVTNGFTDQTQKNKSVVRLWQIETVLPAVNEELNGIAKAWAEELGPELKSAGNNGKKNSRLDVEIRYSRTGLHWMSFAVQARTVYHQKLQDARIETRTYDMETGERIRLADLFNDDDVWTLLADRVRETVTGYWPQTEADSEKVDALCSRKALGEADFTLHGMSLVLHYPSSLVYEGKYTLMEVTFFYPELRPYMTEQADTETDNTRYYKTCALTFDDGPSDANTPKVLNALMETGARGTFFVIGNRMADYDYLVQREHDEGHAIGSHNWHHGNATKSSAAALRRMPEKVNNALNKIIGIPVRYDRVPGGRYPPMQKAKVNWAYIQWSLDTYDWRGGSTAGVMSKVRKHLEDGDIILCHDIKKNTPESTRQIVHYLEEKGYLPLTIDELFAKDGVTLERGKVYFRCQDGVTSAKPAD